MIKLTSNGKAKCQMYINELKAKRKEILDAEKDTADETEIPSIEDIISDIKSFEEDGEYFNGWGCTDNYDADYFLGLTENEDYIIEED